MAFVGHIISSEGVKVYGMNTKAVKNLPRPLTPIDIRSFMGIADYFRMFVDGFECIGSPLTLLTQKIKKLSGRRNVREASKS